jgi:hypothetical protein
MSNVISFILALIVFLAITIGIQRLIEFGEKPSVTGCTLENEYMITTTNKSKVYRCVFEHAECYYLQNQNALECK